MRGSGSGKHEKTRKSREKTARKLLIWNTIEQYTGLNFPAASHFSEEKCDGFQKSQNRHFSHFEQYSRLESARSQNLAVLADSGGQE